MSSLTDAELLAILLRSGTREHSAVEVAQRLLNSCNGNLNRLSSSDLSEIKKTKGVGEVKGITLLAAFEIGKRMRVEAVLARSSITSPKDILELMQDKNAYSSHEEFWVIYIDSANAYLSAHLIGKGGLNYTAVDLRLIMKRAIELNATAMFLCHNHPSGKLTPSEDDIRTTHKIRNAAKTFEIELLDHVIICKNQYLSMFEMGMLG